ncbi:MAG TPA: aromatic-ring-hydroxylating dioxygenase subunit beta [Burkholderiaceae bacterium]|jgi:3-phenylpropionate/cinnamic acid dioxygenase small subunit|nr:aromatic-ring-hydroxylating dioxygenase subunit beta [Burkholderiaceae bacterium]
MTESTRLEILASVLYREAHYLDSHRWDEWLSLYCEDGQFWIPQWTADHSVADVPDPERALIYCGTRALLQERVTLVSTGLSPAWYPVQRTSHSVSTVVATALGDSEAELHASFVCHVWNIKRREACAFFGRYEHKLRRQGGHWLIARKKIVVMNERAPAGVEFYCV